MQRFVWLRADGTVGEWEERRDLIEAAVERGIDGVLVDEADAHRVRRLVDGTVAAFRDGDDGAVLEVSEAEAPPVDVSIVGKDGEGDGSRDRPTTADHSADLALAGDLEGPTGAYVRIDGDAAAAFARMAGKAVEYVIVERADWEVIPLENLIAEIGPTATIAPVVDGPAGAKTAFETLELGADGVILETDDPAVIEATLDERDRTSSAGVSYTWATITTTEGGGMADRVCIDTASMLDPDEGMLVGSHARGLAFIHGETADGPYTDPRPFRVNAGAVHAYVLVPDGRTKYLAELRAGDRVVVADTDGGTRAAVVGRTKLERRPMRRIALEVGNGDTVEVLVQEAETVRVHTRAGPRPVTDVDVGDELLLRYDDVPRHFGAPVEGERLIER